MSFVPKKLNEPQTVIMSFDMPEIKQGKYGPEYQWKCLWNNAASVLSVNDKTNIIFVSLNVRSNSQVTLCLRQSGDGYKYYEITYNGVSMTTAQNVQPAPNVQPAAQMPQPVQQNVQRPEVAPSQALPNAQRSPVSNDLNFEYVVGVYTELEEIVSAQANLTRLGIDNQTKLIISMAIRVFEKNIPLPVSPPVPETMPDGQPVPEPDMPY